MWMYHSNGIDRKSGEEFVFESPVADTPRWSKDNHCLFTDKFKNVCFTLLCIQKYYKIDKNIFLMLIEKIGYGNTFLIDFKTPFNLVLNLMKNSNVRDISKRIEFTNLIWSSGFLIRETGFFNVNEDIYRKGVMSVDKGGKEINYSLLKSGSLYEISIGLSFNFFLEKEQRNKLYQEICVPFSNRREQNISNSKKYVLNSVFLSIIFIFYLVFF